MQVISYVSYLTHFYLQFRLYHESRRTKNTFAGRLIYSMTLLLKLEKLFWKNKNIWTIHDIVDEQGLFLSLEVLKQTHDINCNFLQYNSLKDAIPWRWRQKLKLMKIPRTTITHNEMNMIKINKQLIPSHKITNKLIYWTLIQEKQTPPIIKDKWMIEFSLNEKQWEQIFIISKIINDTKIRVFQYKLLYNLIPCNLYLFRIKRSISYNCQTCNEIDNIIHYTLVMKSNNFEILSNVGGTI